MLKAVSMSYEDMYDILSNTPEYKEHREKTITKNLIRIFLYVVCFATLKVMIPESIINTVWYIVFVITLLVRFMFIILDMVMITRKPQAIHEGVVRTSRKEKNGNIFFYVDSGRKKHHAVRFYKKDIKDGTRVILYASDDSSRHYVVPLEEAI